MCVYRRSTSWFYPYEVRDDGIVQRTFTPAIESPSGEDKLKTRTMIGIQESDYVTSYTVKDGSTLRTSTLELIKRSKEVAGREKDLDDLKLINQIKINQERYMRLGPIMENSPLTIENQSQNSR